MKKLNKPGFYNRRCFSAFYMMLRKKARAGAELSAIEGAWLDELDALRSEWHRNMYQNMLANQPFGGLIIKSI
jgi:hypothetical protein